MFLRILTCFCWLPALALGHPKDLECFELMTPQVSNSDFPKIDFILIQEFTSSNGYPPYYYREVSRKQYTLKKGEMITVSCDATLPSASKLNPRQLYLKFDGSYLRGTIGFYYYETGHGLQEGWAGCKNWNASITNSLYVESLPFFSETRALPQSITVSFDRFSVQILDPYKPIGPDEDLDCSDIASYPTPDTKKIKEKQRAHTKGNQEEAFIKLTHIERISDFTLGWGDESGIKTTEKIISDLSVHLVENETQVVTFNYPLFLEETDFQNANPRNLSLTLKPNKMVSLSIGNLQQRYSSDFVRSSSWQCNNKELDINLESGLDLDFYFAEHYYKLAQANNFIRISAASSVQSSLLALIVAGLLKMLL